MFPVRINTEYSFGDSCIKLESLVIKLQELGYKSFAISDPNCCAWLSCYRLSKKHNLHFIPSYSVEINYRFKNIWISVLCPEYKYLDDCIDLYNKIRHNNVVSNLPKGLVYILPASLVKNGRGWALMFFSWMREQKVRFVVSLNRVYSDYQLSELLNNHSIPTIFAPQINTLQETDITWFKIKYCMQNNIKWHHVMGKKKWKAFSLDEFHNIVTKYRDSRPMVNLEILSDFMRPVALTKPIRMMSLRENNNQDLVSYCTSRLRELYMYDMAYKRRLFHELSIIIKLGFSSYFMFLLDLLKACHDMGIIVNARGSGGGSLVCFLMGATKLDPIRYGLMFARFLNFYRKDMADLDLDVPSDRREEIYQYLKKTYGEECVMFINTFLKFHKKGLVRNLCRVFSWSSFHTKKVSEVIDDIQDKLDLIEHVGQQDHIDLFWSSIGYFDGMVSGRSVHAGGVIVCDYKVPCMNYDSYLVSSWDKYHIEQYGLVKIDILAVDALSMIQDTLRQVNLSWSDITEHDEDTFIFLREYGTRWGLFQQTDSIFNIMKAIAPKDVTQIGDIIAMYRPGPIRYIDQYIWCSKHPERTEFLVEDEGFKQIVESTYGIVLYQEQMISIFKYLGGYNDAQADMFRRSIQKKDPTIIFAARKNFLSHATKKLQSNEEANLLFDTVKDFGGYAFNKSHALAYAFLSYTTAYLKCHYMSFFLTSCINRDLDKFNQVNYIYDLKGQGYNIILPHWLHSKYWTIVKGRDIMLGFHLMKHVNRTTYENISKLDRGLSDLNNVDISGSQLDILWETGVFKGLSYFGQQYQEGHALREIETFGFSFQNMNSVYSSTEHKLYHLVYGDHRERLEAKDAKYYVCYAQLYQAETILINRQIALSVIVDDGSCPLKLTVKNKTMIQYCLNLKVGEYYHFGIQIQYHNYKPWVSLHSVV